MLRIGIDIGGTFTDFVIFDSENGEITTFKLLSDTSDPANTVLQGLEKVLSGKPAQIIHGSTVATNALLERKGTRTALITTSGFRDVLQIGRQNRPELYDWFAAPATALVRSELRYEVDERVDSRGNVVVKLDSSQIETLANQLAQHDVKSVAICLIYSFLYPLHEQLIATRLRDLGYFVSASSEILPEFREYERTSTTVVNAYVSPILDKYLTSLLSALPDSSLQIMQSNGGMMNISDARANGARCILSGPAGGIVGAQHISRTMLNADDPEKSTQQIKIITFDMGGTSTDVSLIKGQPTLTTEAIVGGYPIHLPLLDIHTIGSGGGSIAYVDAGGSLRVGPQSAGANPGPACYGSGEQPTVTDANLVLGRLIPEFFLGGKMKIYPGRAQAALEKLGNTLGLSAIQVAFGVLDVVNIQMERALRVISVERGHDPQEFRLFSFGGAGGLHAADLARDLGIPRVIISRYASTLSALGMLASDVVKDYVLTVMLSEPATKERLDPLFAPILHQAMREMVAQGFSPDKIEIQPSLDLRYTGQSYELNVPYSESYIVAFQEAHHKIYGYACVDKEIEVVNIRVRAVGKVNPITLPSYDNKLDESEIIAYGYTQVAFKDGMKSIPLVKYQQLHPGSVFDGPALIVADDTTVMIGDNDKLHVDRYQNLSIDIGGCLIY